MFDAVLDHAASEALHMSTQGVVDTKTGRKGFMAVLNVVGDWSFLHKCGRLKRSYNDMTKSGVDPGSAEAAEAAVQNKKRKRKEPAGICHLCRAGQIKVPFEEIHSKCPAWLPTMHQQTPWDVPPALSRLDHETGKAASLFAFDLFHAFHLGVGKTHVASCLAALTDCEEGNVDVSVRSPGC